MARPKQTSEESSVNKSQAIRDCMADNPGAKPKEIVEKLAEQGIEVTVGLVYQVKPKANNGPKKKAAPTSKAATSGTSGRLPAKNDALQTILKVKELAGTVGGMNQLKRLVEAMAD